MAYPSTTFVLSLQRNRYVTVYVRLPFFYFANHITEVPGIDTFQDLINNIFAPLFEVTKDPSSHPKLHLFLQQVRLLL